MELSVIPKLGSTLLKNVLNTHKYCSRSAVDLAYKIHGENSTNKPPIVVIHGLLGSKRNWESISRKLASETSKVVVAIDARNHGASPHEPTHTYYDLASDVKQLLEKLSFNEAIMLGHSMGGRTAMVLALTSPKKVSKLIVVDISPVSTPGLLNDFFPRLIDIMRTIDFQGVDSVAKARSLAKEKLVASGIVPNAESAHFIIMNVGVRHDKKIGWLYNVDTLKEYFSSIATFPTDLQGKTYDGPTLFVGGDSSNYLPSSDLDSIRSYFPKANIQYVQNSGHNVHAENPTGFLNIVVPFVMNKV